MFLLSPIYSMSDDGGNVPVVQKTNSSKEVPQIEQQSNLVLDQDAESKSNETVKDRLGVDTRMSTEEYDKFINAYLKKEKQMFPQNKTTMLYNFKIDLNKYDEFLEMGIDLNKSGVQVESKTYKENALYSDIVIIGKTIEKEEITGSDTFKIEILEILKGADILKQKLGEIPKYFNYFDPLNQEPVMDKKGLYFLGFAQDINKDTRCWAQQRTGSTLICLDDNSIVYEKNFKTLNYALYYKNNEKTNDKMLKSEKWKKKIDDLYKSVKMNESWDVAVANVKKIIEINDDKNFYKKTFTNEVEK